MNHFQLVFIWTIEQLIDTWSVTQTNSNVNHIYSKNHPRKLQKCFRMAARANAAASSGYFTQWSSSSGHLVVELLFLVLIYCFAHVLICVNIGLYSPPSLYVYMHTVCADMIIILNLSHKITTIHVLCSSFYYNIHKDSTDYIPLV